MTAAPTRRRTRALPDAATAATAAAVAGITAIAAALRFHAFSSVPPNLYYDAAVRSMAMSWHNFFYGAFEPSAQVSIDKTPVDLWLQVASVKLLGFSSVATRLPEAVAGVLAVPLLYDLVRRLFGRIAGLGAAAALAVLPVAIVTAHSDTMDSLMMLLDVLAAWLVVVGAQRRAAWPIVAAGAVMGLAFNVKLFEALIVAPALVVLALLAVDLPARRRIAAFAGGLVAFVAVALAWVGTASLASPGARPWPIGSTDGTVWSVVFGFNGLDRLRSPATPAALKLDPPGTLRLFATSGHWYGSRIGTLLIAALVLGATAVLVAVVARRRVPRDRLRVAGAVFLATWLVPGVWLVSHMQRLQPRYLEAVNPAVAAAVGAGLAYLAARSRDRRAVALVAAAACALVAVGAADLVHPPVWATVLALAGAAGAAVCAVAMAAGGTARLAYPLAAFGLVAVLAVPSASALSAARRHASDAGLPSRFTPAQVTALSRYLTAHQGRAFYETASSTVQRAAPLIVHDGRPVLMLTSLHSRPLLTAHRLARLVAAGRVRYALLGRGSCARPSKRCPPVMTWARAHARDVSRAAGLGRTQVLFRLR